MRIHHANEEAMRNHEVSWIANGDLSKMRKHTLDVEIKNDELSPHRQLGEPTYRFLILKQDLAKFLRYLRIMVGSVIF